MLKIICRCGVEIIIAIVIILNCSFHYSNDWGKLIHADGNGYYAYLPAVFIYQDPEFKFFDRNQQKYSSDGKRVYFDVDYHSGHVDKYFCGVAILQIPFFFAAHLSAKISGLPADGYSLIYQLFFMLGATVYFYLGLKALKWLVQQYCQNEWVALFIILLIALGTNLFYFATMDVSYSHVYSFFAMNIFLVSMYRIFHLQDRKYLWLAALAFGLIIVLRPVNMLILFSLPFLAGSFRNLIEGLKLVFKPDKKLVFAALLFCLPVFIQMAVWHWQTGQFIVYSYTSERFYFNRPKIYAVLFGFRKGWFLWTPMAFIGILGYLVYLWKNTYAFLTFTIFFYAFVYVLSCWWDCYYGMSFGAREFIEFLAFPAIGLALLFGGLASRYMKGVLAFLCVLCLGLNQLQMYQYRHFILLWTEMTSEKYWKVFGKTDQRYEGLLWKDNNAPPPDSISVNSSDISDKYVNGFEKEHQWGGHEVRNNDEHHSGQWSNYVDRHNDFSATLSRKLDPNMFAIDSLVNVSVWVKGILPTGTQIVVSFNKNSNVIAWHTYDVDLFMKKDNTWTKCYVHCNFPDPADSAQEMRVFVWGEKLKDPLYIDDFEVDIIKQKNSGKALQ